MFKYVSKIALVALALSWALPASAASYYVRWDKVGGGWTTGWVQQSSGDPNAGKCGNFDTYKVSCGCDNSCGWYGNGARITHYPNGCHGNRWTLVCRVKRQ
ncbi:hypothetical protein [uncultured Cohaesibacter sp.]|uniref:hypothetical protein n=1 Tax=uncultured Cohaesibacter sp. TaxID=1002546 RepID=UPI00292E7C4A|nr:hypothetical protein [uncultured Cohaesibacter sp.]